MIDLTFGDARTCIATEENIVSKVAAILGKIVEFARMLELSELVAEG